MKHASAVGKQGEEDDDGNTELELHSNADISRVRRRGAARWQHCPPACRSPRVPALVSWEGVAGPGWHYGAQRRGEELGQADRVPSLRCFASRSGWVRISRRCQPSFPRP